MSKTFEVKVKLKVEPEFGGVFYFKPLDSIISAVLNSLSEEDANKLAKMKDDENGAISKEGTEELANLCIEVFNLAVIGWEDVVNEDGKPLEFNEDNKKWFLPNTKKTIGMEMILQMLDVNEKKE